MATSALVLTSAGAIFYAGLQLRHEREYRAITNLEKQLEFFHSEKFRQARSLLARDRLDDAGALRFFEASEPPVSVFEVLDFYEHLGLLVKKGHLEIYDVWHTFYEWVQPVYSDMRGVIESKQVEWSWHYSDLRRLVAGMDRIQRERTKGKQNRQQLWSAERIAEHYRYEIEAGGDSLPLRLRAPRRRLTPAP